MIKERVIFAQKKKKRVLSRFSLENNQDIIFGDTIEINENEYAFTVENTENILGSECQGSFYWKGYTKFEVLHIYRCEHEFLAYNKQYPIKV